MIWRHEPDPDIPAEAELNVSRCIFCGGGMHRLLDSPRIGLPATELRCCRCCGWWTYWRMTGKTLLDICHPGEQPGWSLYGVVAALKTFDLADIKTPLEEVKRYLLVKYRARFECHPRLFEETVASVFAGMGYSAEATAYSRDGGVDVILRHGSGITTGVQVKRSRNPIQVEQIRSFSGALLIGGHTAGIFVTTSRFTSGADAARNVLATRGCPIEFIDAKKFFDALKLSQRPLYSGYEDWLQTHGEPELHTICEDGESLMEGESEP